MWLKILILSTLICLCLTYSEGKKHKCKELEECVKGENDINCVKRYKRHCQGSSSCNECDCEYCSTNTCSSTCNSCCANFVQPCSSNYCCYKTCHAQCSSNACRKSCRGSCTKKVAESQSSQTVNSQLQQANAVNITTVINLHNKINNTNQIDIPVNVNSTNYNNFTIDTANEYQGYYSGEQRPVIVPPPTYPDSPQVSPSPETPQPTQRPQIQQPSCCQIVGPRQCVAQPQYPFTRCFHLRRKQCGNICSSAIMHAHQHQVCEEVTNGQQSCHNQLFYIPQPQTRCIYQQSWPYITCGIPQPNCEGCYGQFGGEERKAGCSSNCFQDRFADGQYFRPGPINPGFGMNPMMGGGMFQPNFDNSYSITMDPSKRSNQDSNAIVVPPEVKSSKSMKENEMNGNGNSNGNGGNGNGLPIEVIQDGISINEIPSSFMPYPVPPYVQYPPYPPMGYPPIPQPFPFWPPQPPYPGIPIQEGEVSPLFSENKPPYSRVPIPIQGEVPPLFSENKPPYSRVPVSIQEGEVPILFAENNYHYKRGTNVTEKSEEKETNEITSNENAEENKTD